MPEDHDATWGPGGDPARWAAALREFAQAAGAMRVVLVLERGPEDSMLLDGGPLGPVQAGIGDVIHTLAAEIVAAAAPAIEIPSVLPPQGLAVRPQTAEVVAGMGAVAGLAVAVRELAAGLPGSGIATVQWATDSRDCPFSIAARPGEPLVLAVGDEVFPMGEGWPDGC